MFMLAVVLLISWGSNFLESWGTEKIIEKAGILLIASVGLIVTFSTAVWEDPYWNFSLQTVVFIMTAATVSSISVAVHP